ncbi:MAG: ATP-binding cassette domain-containing protein [Candidatus Bathyarchaeia archaeon]
MKKPSERLRELFEITKVAKKFDKRSGTFNISISYKTAPYTITHRTLAVAEAFGIGLDQQQKQILYDNLQLRISPKDIVYITGESGSGKTVLLKKLEKLLSPNTANIKNMHAEQHKPIIDTVGKNVEEALGLLSRVGLNDAFLFLRSYSQLSDGQKYRYKIAKLMETGKQYWIMDEFGSTLDRDMAKIVAFNVQKIARQTGKAVLAATTHTDLFEDLAPSIHIHKHFGKEIEIKYYPNKLDANCSLTKLMHIQEGTITDYRKLSQYHYRQSTHLPPPRKIFTIRRNDTKELVGIIVYSYPTPQCFGRKKAVPKLRLTLQQLNKNFSLISRVILHPKYRTIGLGAKLVKETLPKAGTPYVEAVAVMAKYNPFFEKAGMKKITIQKPHPTNLKAAKKLQKLGFNPAYMASEKYALAKLKKMSQNQITQVKNILASIESPRLRRVFVTEKPYINNKTYKQALETTSIEKIAKALRILNIHLQTKAYLIWKVPER